MLVILIESDSNTIDHGQNFIGYLDTAPSQLVVKQYIWGPPFGQRPWGSKTYGRSSVLLQYRWYDEITQGNERTVWRMQAGSAELVRTKPAVTATGSQIGLISEMCIKLPPCCEAWNDIPHTTLVLSRELIVHPKVLARLKKDGRCEQAACGIGADTASAHGRCGRNGQFHVNMRCVRAMATAMAINGTASCHAASPAWVANACFSITKRLAQLLGKRHMCVGQS